MAEKPKNRREALRAQQAAEQARQQRQRRMVTVGAIVTILVVVAVVVAVFVQKGTATPSGKATPTAPATTAGAPWSALYAESNGGIVINPTTAKPNAPVVDIYLDFQCSHCHTFEVTYGPEINKLAQAGDFKFVYHNMTFMEGQMNTSSTRPAIGAICASNYGVYSEYMLAVFDAAGKPGSSSGQETYSDDLLRNKVPADIGFSGDLLAGFQKCYDDKAPKSLLDKVTSSANASFVQGTPTVRVNGKDINLSSLPADPSKLGSVLKAAA